jgi:hypothetical protein
LRIDPEDGPSRTMIQRCAAYKEKPPKADWDGAFTMVTK